MSQVKLGNKNIPFIYQGNELLYPNPVKDGLVLWYDFKGMKNSDVTKGVAKDLSGNGNDGMLYNSAYNTVGSGYVEGLNLDGIDDFIEINQINNKLNNLKEMTIEITLKFNETPDFWRWLISNNTDSAGGKGYAVAISPQSSQGLSFIMGGTVVSSGITPKEKEKYHITSQSDSNGNMKLIINGGQKTNINKMIKDPEASSLNFYVGKASYYPSPFLNSEIYNIRIYDRVLTEEEIQHNYNLEKERWGL